MTPWTVACQAPLSTEFPRQEYQNGLPFPTPGDLPDPGIEPSLASPTLAGGFFTTVSPANAGDASDVGSGILAKCPKKKKKEKKRKYLQPKENHVLGN